MKVAKWGNSLAVRLPTALVEALDLKQGDEIDLEIAGRRELDISKQRERAELVARLHELLKGRLPPGYRFNRDELYER